MTVRIQGCVCTASSSKYGQDNFVYGRLTLSAGAWYFGYDMTDEQVWITWAPSVVALPSSPATTKILFRLWNVSSKILNETPETKAIGVQPVLQKEVDLDHRAIGGYKQKLSLKLNAFLVFGFEGRGPALGEQEKKDNDELSERLSAMQTELDRVKQQSDAKIVFSQGASAAEKAAMRRAFDVEKATLKDGFDVQKADLQREMQERVRDLEQRLSNTMRELGEANNARARVEKLCVATKDIENALREENLRVCQERDDIKAKFQLLQDEMYALNQAQRNAKKASETQANSISGLIPENANGGAESAGLSPTPVPEKNVRFREDTSWRQDTDKAVEKDVKYENTKEVEPKVRLTPQESEKLKLGPELRKVKNDLANSESTRSRLQEENDRAAARIAGLETEASKRQEQIQQLTQDLREQKASHEAALRELDQVKKLMPNRLSGVDKTISDLNLKITELEKRIESTMAEKNGLDRENLELKNSLSREKTERQAFENNDARLRAEIDKLKNDLDRANLELKNVLSREREERQAAENNGDRLRAEIDKLKNDLNIAKLESKNTLPNENAEQQAVGRNDESLRAEIDKLKNDLDIANLELKNVLAREKEERQAAENNNGRLRADIDRLKNRVDTAERRVSMVRVELSTTKSNLQCCQGLLKEERARYAKLLYSLKCEKAKYTEIKRKLDASEAAAKTSNVKWTKELEDARAKAKEFADSYDSIKGELEKTKQELAAEVAKLADNLNGFRAEAKGLSDLYNRTKDELEQAKRELAAERRQSEQQAGQLKAETERTEELETKLEKAFQRWLEFDRNRPQAQPGNERSDPRRDNEALEIEKAQHAADVSRLEIEIERMDGEIKHKDDRIRYLSDSTVNLERRLQQELDLKAALELKVHDLERQVTQLIASLGDEHNNREQLENRLNSEISSHADTRQALTNMTRRATNMGNQLSQVDSQLSQQRNKLEQAKNELEIEQSRVRWATSELEDKRNELQQAKLTVSNQKAKIRSLEGSTKHSNCVTKDSVEKVIGSYERLHEFAKRKGSRRKTLTLHKAHYPDGLGWADGKFFVKFRDEWF